MKLLSIISEIRLFNSALVEKSVLLKNSKNTVDVTLNKDAPLKKRYLEANQAPFINKTISKETMKQSRLRNNFLNTKI